MAQPSMEVWVCRANPEALAWTVEALHPLVLEGIQPAYIGKGASPTLDLTWLLVGSKMANHSSSWDAAQNFNVAFPVERSVAESARAVKTNRTMGWARRSGSRSLFGTARRQRHNIA